jgi:hypothetical protein
MKKQLLKRFYACLPALRTATGGGPVGIAYIVTAMMFSASANAQIVYTDVNPDNQIDSTNIIYNLDLNNDAITDFNITYTTLTQTITCGGTYIRTSYIIEVAPLDSNEVGKDISGNGFPSALLLNSPIDDTLFTWLNGGSRGLAINGWTCGGPTMMQLHTYFACNFLNASSKYLALKLHVASQVYYGWVRLSVASGVINATIFDYAYNSSPGQPILAGQTTATGINENSFAASINVFPNPATNHLTIALGSNSKRVEVTIADITGKIIYSTTASDPDSPDSYRDREQKIEVNTQYFAEGVYLVQVQSGEFIETKKIMVEK